MDWHGTQVYAPDINVPLLAEVDTVVVGGGAAGVAAAETAARHGLRTLLIERYGFCGGNAVAGMSGTICGLFLSTERRGNRPEQVVFGFADRFYRAMMEVGGVTEPQQYGKTWTVTHDPLRWREVADAFLEAAGASILYHSLVTGVLMEGEVFHGVVVETKAGPAKILSKTIVDASGDGDVIYRAGFGYMMGLDGIVQNPTMIFRLAGVDVGRFLDYWGPDTICSAEVTQKIITASQAGRYRLPRAKIWLFRTPRPGEILCNATRVIGRDGRDLNPVDPMDWTEAELSGRLQVREYARFLRDHIPGCEEAFVNDTGVQVGIRQTRSITGVERLSNEDVVSKRKRLDAIARSPWPIELHVGDKLKLEWLLDDFYEVPFGALLPEKGENLVVAGRCLSAEHEALASARVTAQCFSYGHAAGMAAVMSVKEGIALRQIDGAGLRRQLNRDGARLDEWRAAT